MYFFHFVRDNTDGHKHPFPGEKITLTFSAGVLCFTSDIALSFLVLMCFCNMVCQECTNRC